MFSMAAEMNVDGGHEGPELLLRAFPPVESDGTTSAGPATSAPEPIGHRHVRRRAGSDFDEDESGSFPLLLPTVSFGFGFALL
jgi:hypothetical protein